MRVMSGRAVVLVWLVCKVAGGPSRTPATCQGRDPQTDNLPPPQGGHGYLFFAFLTLFRLLWRFVLAFYSLAGAFDSPSKRGTSRWLGPSAEAGNININIMRPTHAVNMANTANMARAAALAGPCETHARSHQRRAHGHLTYVRDCLTYAL